MKKAALLLIAASSVLLADLAAIRQEKNLEHRSDLALVEAEQQIEDARQAYQASAMDKFKKSLEDARQAVELSYKSLKDTGKSARRHPKYFKRADLKLHDILRHIDGLEHDVGFDDRQMVTALKKRVSEIDDQIVLDIMRK